MISIILRDSYIIYYILFLRNLMRVYPHQSKHLNSKLNQNSINQNSTHSNSTQSESNGESGQYDISRRMSSYVP